MAEVLRLADSEAGSSAAIAINYGFNCFSFTCHLAGKPRELLYAEEGFPSKEHRPSHHGTPVLAPFPNRIRAGRFQYGGRDYSLPLNHGNTAIHGFVIDQQWRLVEHGTSDELGAWATGEFHLAEDRPDLTPLWPGDFMVSMRYSLKGTTLATLIRVENPSGQVTPFGFGTHPYFRFPVEANGSPDDCEILSPVSRQVELADALPTGALSDLSADLELPGGMPLGRRSFDDVFTGLSASDGTVTHLLRDRRAGVQLALKHDEQFRFVVIYTPAHGRAVCIEPYTCVTDAVNLESATFPTGLWELGPGEQRELTIRYEGSTF